MSFLSEQRAKNLFELEWDDTHYKGRSELFERDQKCCLIYGESLLFEIFVDLDSLVVRLPTSCREMGGVAYGKDKPGPSVHIQNSL